MIAISQSEIAAWARDPRKWFILYYLGYAPAAEPATGNRQLGIRVHTALEGFYGYELDPSLVLAAVYGIEMREHPEEAAELRKEHALADIMVTGYVEWLTETGADAHLRVVATETDLQVPLPGVEGVLLRARMDQVSMDDTDGTLRFMDYKTADNFERHELLELDPQMAFYSLVQHLAVKDRPGSPVVAGGQITTLRRVKRTSASKPPYYDRHSFRFNEPKITSTYYRVRRIAAEILEARKALDWIANQAGGHIEYASGEVLKLLENYQQEYLRPVPIIHDCRWACPLASGLCAMMDDGSDWLRSLTQSDHWQKVDPYAYYRSDALSSIRAEITRQAQPEPES